jgi:hypothetical protein
VAGTIDAQAAVNLTRIDRARIERKMHAVLAAWHPRLTGAVARVRQTLREMLVAPLVVRPHGRVYRFEGEVILDRLLTGDISLATYVARPACLRSCGATARHKHSRAISPGDISERAAASEPRERSGDHGVPASERARESEGRSPSAKVGAPGGALERLPLKFQGIAA